jgi:formylglycine-generating enzyme required for sulfatase activity
MPPAGFVPVAAGAFVYGPEVVYERSAQQRPPRPRQALELEGFWIAVRPVTNAEWKRYLDDSGDRWGGQWWALRTGLRGRLRRFAPVTHYPAELASHPIVDVARDEALAYCAWLSDRLGRRCSLPSEEQWEKAARGTDGRGFPWGEDPPRPELMHLGTRVGLRYYAYNLFVRPRVELARSGWYWRAGSTLPVGAIARNVSPYGCYDMAGNIWEWTNSPYNPELPDFHVVKGGSWGYSVHHTRCNVRSACSVTIPSRDYRAQGTGFRVLIDEPPSARPLAAAEGGVWRVA